MNGALINALLSLIAVGAGASFVVQQIVNAQLRLELGSAFWAGFVSYLGGTLAMLVAVFLAGEGWLSFAAAGKSSWSSWTGGVFGAIYIAISILLLPRLGTATVVGLIVAGQLLTSVAFDHFGAFGTPVHPLSMARVAGALLLMSGAFLIRF